MRVGALAVALERAGLDVLLGVVERAAGVAHEDRARDGHDGRADEQTADELHAEHEAAHDRDQQRQHGRQQHLLERLPGGHFDAAVVIRADRALKHAGAGQLPVALVGHEAGGFDGVVGQERGEVFDERAADDAAGDNDVGGHVEDRLCVDSRVVADVGDDQRDRGERGGADGEALADGGGGVADGVELVGNGTDGFIQMAGFRQTAGVVGDGAESVDGDRRADKGQHAEAGEGNAVGAADLAGDEQGHADQQNRQQARTRADGVALGDDERVALGGDLRQTAGGLIVGGGVVFGDGADGDAAGDAEHARDPRRQPAAAEARVQGHVREDQLRRDEAAHDRQTRRDPGGEVQLVRGIVAHLLDGGIAKTKQAAEQAAARQHDGEDGGRGEGRLGHSLRTAGERAFVDRDRDHQGRGHGGDEALEQVGAVAGNVVDVVADEVGDDVRHAAVILGHVVAELGQDVGGDIGRLGIVAAGHAVEHGDDGAAEGIRGDAHDGGIALKVGQEARADRGRVHAVPDDQDQDHAQHAERLHRQARDAAAAERDLDGLADGERFARAVGGADVCIRRAAHAEDAHDAGHARAHDKGDAARLFHEQAEYCRDHDHDDRNDAEFRLEEGACAVTDDAGHLLHLVRPLRQLPDAGVLEEDIGQRKNDYAQNQMPYIHTSGLSLSFSFLSSSTSFSGALQNLASLTALRLQFIMPSV